jgi:hypothetical protein
MSTACTFATALQQHSDRQQQQVRSRARVAAVHAVACWQERGNNEHNSSSSGSNSSTTAGSSGSNSSSIHTSCVQRATVPGGFTLMHAAAAARSLSCAELLLRHGVNAAAAGQYMDNSGMSSVSALDLLVLPSPNAQLLPRIQPAELEPAEFEQFALMLLSCGATIKHSAMSSDQYKRYAGALSKHTARQQQQARRKERIAVLQAAAS